MKKYNHLKLFVFSSLFVLGACGATPKPMPVLTFGNLKPENIHVGYYEVAPVPALDANTRQFFAVDPGAVLYDYFSHRYRAAGGEGTFRISVKDIAVTHSVLPSNSTVGAFLNVDKKDRYDITAVVDAELVGGAQGMERQQITVRSKRMISLPEHYSIADREREQALAINDLINDLDRTLQAAIKDQFQIQGGF